LQLCPSCRPTLSLAVNVSPETVLDPELSAMLEEQGERRVIIEVTEHAIVNDYEPLKRVLHDLRGHARIAVDDTARDIGLRHILDLKPDLIKLDMSLTRDVHRDPARAAMTAALVRFAREIGSLIVAEGVQCERESRRCDGSRSTPRRALPTPADAARRRRTACRGSGKAA
jgi:EAL domain-containing protein (putative c-di-GMP-specific phosphodiesterase class I)